MFQDGQNVDNFLFYRSNYNVKAVTLTERQEAVVIETGIVSAGSSSSTLHETWGNRCGDNE